MSKETRTVRPFVGLEDISGVLNESMLHFGNDSCLVDGSIIVEVTPHAFLLRPVALEWAADGAAFESFKKQIADGVTGAGLSREDVALVAFARTPFLRIAEQVFALSLSELDRLDRVTTLTHDPRPVAFSAPFSGFVVDLYVLLSRSRQPQALRPYRKGTWLAAVQFRVGTTEGPAILPPTPLTEEVRDRFSLLPKTARYTSFGDHDVLQPYAEQEQPVFYVDEKLLAEMNARRHSAGSKALQLQLAQDFVSSVIRRASQSPDLLSLTYEDLRRSLLGSVLRIAAGPSPTPSDLGNLVGKVHTDPDWVAARAEHFIDVISAFTDVLEDGES